MVANTESYSQTSESPREEEGSEKQEGTGFLVKRTQSTESADWYSQRSGSL